MAFYINEDFEFVLFDRIEKIKQINEQYDLENNTYISFSGGKDSTVLSHLIDLALPNNTIPRVYKDTGIEYPQVRKFVRKMVLNDKRFVYIKPEKNIKKTLKKVGYPFKSKQHSHNFQIYKNNIENCEKYKKIVIENNIVERIKTDTYTKEDVDFIANLPTGTKTFIKYYFGIREKERELSTSMKIVPNVLKYQFEPEYARTHNWSDMCCKEFKHGILSKLEKEMGYKYTFLGMRREEGGNREKLKCITKGSNSIHFNVLVPVSEEWEEEFIKRYNIELCELYLPPYNFKRQGCLFCPFSLDLQEQLDIMQEINPNLVKQANVLWDVSYNEYKRIGYRLRKNNSFIQLSLFDFLD